MATNIIKGRLNPLDLQVDVRPKVLEHLSLNDLQRISSVNREFNTLIKGFLSTYFLNDADNTWIDWEVSLINEKRNDNYKIDPTNVLVRMRVLCGKILFRPSVVLLPLFLPMQKAFEKTKPLEEQFLTSAYDIDLKDLVGVVPSVNTARTINGLIRRPEFLLMMPQTYYLMFVVMDAIIMNTDLINFPGITHFTDISTFLDRICEEKLFANEELIQIDKLIFDFFHRTKKFFPKENIRLLANELIENKRFIKLVNKLVAILNTGMFPTISKILVELINRCSSLCSSQNSLNSIFNMECFKKKIWEKTSRVLVNGDWIDLPEPLIPESEKPLLKVEGENLFPLISDEIAELKDFLTFFSDHLNSKDLAQNVIRLPFPISFCHLSTKIYRDFIEYGNFILTRAINEVLTSPDNIEGGEENRTLEIRECTPGIGLHAYCPINNNFILKIISPFEYDFFSQRMIGLAGNLHERIRNLHLYHHGSYKSYFPQLAVLCNLEHLKISGYITTKEFETIPQSVLEKLRALDLSGICPFYLDVPNNIPLMTNVEQIILPHRDSRNSTYMTIREDLRQQLLSSSNAVLRDLPGRIDSAALALIKPLSKNEIQRRAIQYYQKITIPYLLDSMFQIGMGLSMIPTQTVNATFVLKLLQWLWLSIAVSCFTLKAIGSNCRNSNYNLKQEALILFKEYMAFLAMVLLETSKF